MTLCRCDSVHFTHLQKVYIWNPQYTRTYYKAVHAMHETDTIVDVWTNKRKSEKHDVRTLVLAKRETPSETWTTLSLRTYVPIRTNRMRSCNHKQKVWLQCLSKMHLLSKGSGLRLVITKDATNSSADQTNPALYSSIMDVGCPGENTSSASSLAKHTKPSNCSWDTTKQATFEKHKVWQTAGHVATFLTILVFWSSGTMARTFWMTAACASIGCRASSCTVQPRALPEPSDSNNASSTCRSNGWSWSCRFCRIQIFDVVFFDEFGSWAITNVVISSAAVKKVLKSSASVVGCIPCAYELESSGTIPDTVQFSWLNCAMPMLRLQVVSDRFSCAGVISKIMQHNFTLAFPSKPKMFLTSFWGLSPTSAFMAACICFASLRVLGNIMAVYADAFARRTSWAIRRWMLCARLHRCARTYAAHAFTHAPPHMHTGTFIVHDIYKFARTQRFGSTDGNSSTYVRTHVGFQLTVGGWLAAWCDVADKIMLDDGKKIGMQWAYEGVLHVRTYFYRTRS